LKEINDNPGDVKLVDQLTKDIESVRNEIAKVIIGQNEIINNLIISILSQGHCLLIGVPGLAKTMLIKTIAEVFELEFSRIQFTPDLMPGDITGTEIIEEDSATGKRSFRFIKGPVFANIILADEINRTPPKTQSALLEAMQEHKITAAGETYQLEEPFFVLATQNPIEQEGTYPLPEAQLDRFMFSLWLDYPKFEEEIQIIKSTTSQYVPELHKILSAETIIQYQKLVRRVPVADNVIEYAINLVKSTRPNTTEDQNVKEWVSWGAGPRASQYLILAAKAKSIIEGRFTPEIEDIQQSIVPVLRHRIIPSFNAEAEGIDSVKIINHISGIVG
jgi:MoxR-like ATPase